MKQSFPKISVIIPAHNEAKSIRHVLKGLPLRKLHEVILVDNGSTDGTGRAASGVSPKIRIIREERLGYGQACLTGIEHLDPSTEIVVFIDGDYSDHGEELPKLVKPILSGRVDFVVGSRARGQVEPGALTIPQVFGNWLATTLMRIIWNGKFTDLGPFRAIRYDTLMGLGMADRNFGWTVEMQIKVLQQRIKYTERPVSYRRRIGTSKISGTISGTFKAGYKILYTIGRFALSGAPR